MSLRIVVDGVEVQLAGEELTARYTPKGEKYSLEGHIKIPQAKKLQGDTIPKAINFLDMVKAALEKIVEP